MAKAEEIVKELEKAGSPEMAAHSHRYFKTGKGEYAEGDVFLGMKTQTMKDLAKKHKSMDLSEVEKLLHNKYHEARSLALTVLTMQYPKASFEKKKEIIDLYLNNREYINNWDLVDISAYKLLGEYVIEIKETSLLYDLAHSGHLWSERMSVISCLNLIKKGRFEDILKLSKHFLTHKHDLMHKAVGWMLRETGKMDSSVLYAFLDEHAKEMPRTMLRYSIEKLPPLDKKRYMAK